MTGCGGCLGRLVLLGLLAWSIGGLAQLLGWPDTATGGVFLVAVLALLVIGTSDRRRVSTYRSIAPGARTPGDRRVDRMPQPTSERAARHPGQGYLRATGPSPRPGEARGGRLPRRGQTPTADGVGRARDPLPAQLRFGVLQRDGFRCRYCGRPGSAPGVVLHVDHVVPLAVGGATSEDNLLTACEECNLGKATRAVVRVGS